VKSARINLKIDKADLDDWRRQASESGMALSKWIREKCSDGSSPIQTVREVKRVRVVERSVDTGARVEVDLDGDCIRHKYGPGKCPFPGCVNYKGDK
jgi:hypothetical protein